MNHGVVVSVSEVLQVEAEEILLRRRKAGLNSDAESESRSPSDNGESSDAPRARLGLTQSVSAAAITSDGNSQEGNRDGRPSLQQQSSSGPIDAANLNTVGPALSGGGIRSGSIGLGFLQSLYRRGILRHVDYLSTVSGGGYAGAFFSSLIMDSRFPRINWKPGKRTGDCQTLDIIPDASGRQPESLAPLFFGGERLNDPLPFASRWFLGVLLLNLCIFSGLVAAAALLAWIFRFVDMQAPMVFLSEIGVVSDRARSFFLPMLALALWITSVALSRYSRRIAKLRTPLFAVFCVAFALGVCSFLTTADLAAPTAERGMETVSEWREQVSTWTDKAITFLIVALGGALLPYLNPRGLLRSGQQPRNAIEKWTFGIASRAFLYGVPLLLFVYFARENVSGYSNVRQREVGLHHQHLDKFNTFWERVWWEHEKGLEPGRSIWTSVNAASLPNMPENPAATGLYDGGPLAQIVARYEYFRRRDQSIGKNLLRTGKALLPWTWPNLLESYRERRATRAAQGEVADSLNRLMAKSELANNVINRGFGSPRIAHAYDGNRVQELLSEARNLPRPVDPVRISAQDHSPEERRSIEEWRRLNWDLLRAHYGPAVRSRETVFASVVADRDQALRLTVCGGALAVFLLTGLLIDLNAISLHGYYRQKLGEIWISEMPGCGYRIPIRELKTTRKGGPYHLINGTLNLMRRGADASRSETARFTFSHRYCGSSRTGYARTDFYDGGKVDLADAIGISAAAVNPASVRNPLVRVLLLVLNFRLGQWVPNPARRSMGTWWATPIRLFFNWIRYGVPEDRAYCFVTDGGHDENTAVGALLERRCRVIIAVDASQDPDYQFADFLKLIRVAVVKHGVQIVDLASESKALSFAALKPDEKTRLATTHFLVARIKYPEGSASAPSGGCDGYLLFVKPNLTNDEPTELLHYRTENPDFPHDPTLDQFYDPLRFACYRQIGEHLGERLCDEFFDEAKRPQTRETGMWLAERWTPELGPFETAAEQSPIDVPDSYRASTREALLRALWSDDACLQERAVDVFRLQDAPVPPPKNLHRQAVDDLIMAFGIAHGRNKLGLQKAICTVAAQYAARIPKAAAFIKDVSSGKLPVSEEVREHAQTCVDRKRQLQEKTTN